MVVVGSGSGELLVAAVVREGRIAHFTSELIKSGLIMLKNFQVDHRQG